MPSRSLGDVDTSLPFLAYGFLHPGEIAYPQIERFVGWSSTASIKGQLRLRDGMPFLELGDDLLVEGSMIRFMPGLAEAAYRAIAELKPGNLYKWESCDVWERGSKTQANVLVGRSPQAGWSEVLDADDPLFNEALEVIESIATEPPPQNPTDLRAFFRKQMAYLLLWNSIERNASLRWGFGSGPTARVRHLADEEVFRTAIAQYGGEKREIRSTADPRDKAVLDKTNLRKGERQIVEHSLEELLKIYQFVLDATVNAWCELGGEDLSGRCPRTKVGLPPDPQGKGTDPCSMWTVG